MELLIELLGAIELAGAMPVSVLGLDMLSVAFFAVSGAMVLLLGLMELLLLLWAKAAGARSEKAQAAVMKIRDIG